MQNLPASCSWKTPNGYQIIKTAKGKTRKQAVQKDLQFGGNRKQLQTHRQRQRSPSRHNYYVSLNRHQTLALQFGDVWTVLALHYVTKVAAREKIYRIEVLLESLASQEKNIRTYLDLAGDSSFTNMGKCPQKHFHCHVLVAINTTEFRLYHPHKYKEP